MPSLKGDIKQQQQQSTTGRVNRNGVTAVTRKRSLSFFQKCSWQVTAKHAYTLCMWLCMKSHGAWLYRVHRTRRDGSSFMWHQPCQRCKYITSVDIQKHAKKDIHSCRITGERIESARERRIALYKSDHQSSLKRQTDNSLSVDL